MFISRSLRAKATQLRSSPLQIRNRRRSYYTVDHPDPTPFSETESAILSSALSRVPTHGFSQKALKLGARDAGYLDVSTNLFPRGTFDLVNYHLVTRRMALKEEVQFPELDTQSGNKLGVGARVRILALARLRANKDIIGKWQDAIAIMAQPSYVSASLSELARLSDEIWYLAGDKAVDASWYTKRATLSAIYSAAELHQTQDQSPNFIETERFLDSRLEDLRKVSSLAGGFGGWVGYTAQSAVNVLRSKGVKI
ncbi:ubiquinone biosynthesis protein COQ9 [Pseudovirgaria hyperparasitica]|uniref:Ubiquinone biosynthesis protein n=1 Tax=Pseudovirgaria hyperparasitica TaxID=470096 RepID=A0A6A6VWJ7_9PEZI|nr:ubiquinone biosynthesis protein COQ9 [Pseudovirgaria hyperparasitica]KAF2753611.1 ubiquinone biosynthesis protein COQ9 [Pseudovirgaria hyperparasitica]